MFNSFYKKFILIFPLLLFGFLLIIKTDVFASENLPVVTIINPIRGNEWHQKIDVLSSLKDQWKAIKNEKVSATWLLQYTALEDDNLVSFAKDNMKDQEFGIFLEIDRNTAEKANVKYRGQGPLYFSDGLFLVSYDLDERKRIIDKIFSKFKEKFGFYPKTVGAWWIGADSLAYMQKKYGITAAMKAADQFDLDVYSIWGGPWSVPYIASKENEGVPADSFADSSKVVMIQWAPRDPLRGYADAMFSLQDFSLQGYPFSYTDYISSIYLKKPIDNVNVGLENGATFSLFEGYYKDKLAGAKKLEKENKIQILTVKDYSEKFLSKRKIYADSDVKYFSSKDYKSDDSSFWYHSNNFKAGFHKIGDNIYLIDLHDYSKKVKEEYSLLPNSQGYLRTSTPTIIDSMRFPESKIFIAKNKEPFKVVDKNNEVTLLSGSQKLAYFTKSSLELFPENGDVKKFDFSKKAFTISIFHILLTIVFIYSVVIYFYKKDILRSIIQFFVLLIPLFVASPFLSRGDINNLYYIFDRKQLFLFSYLPTINTSSIQEILLLFQIIPFALLLIANFVFINLLSKKIYKILFFTIYIAIIIIYAHIFYFPLDKSTYFLVFEVFVVIFSILIALAFFAFKKSILRIRSGLEKLLVFLLCIPFILGLLGGTMYLSRTKLILSPFEIDALNVIKEKQKDVLFVSETDYNIKPIYKAVKPVLYEDYTIGEKLTGTNWDVVIRPEDNILKVSNIDNKLILVPRYLGADLSTHEMNLLGLKKIFDNAQIAIFEKK